MPKTTAGLLAAIMLATTSSGAMAQSLTWRISDTAGAVAIRHGTTSTPATRGAVLAPGDAVTTGAGGRAVLVHDRDFVTVSANSRVSVPVAEEATGFVKIVQDLGNAIFKIQKLGVPHFGVKTPYLAAVVKGTTFSVTVDRAGTSLQVVEGAVEVATLDGGARDLIRPGSVASIGASDLFRLQVHGDGDRTIDSPARGAAVTGAVTPAATTVVASAEPVAAADVVVADLPAAPQEIGEAISSKPVDLAAMTGGMMTGSTAAVSATLIASVKADLVRPTAPEPTAAPAAPPVAEAPPTAPPPEVATVTSPPPEVATVGPPTAEGATATPPPAEVATATPPPAGPAPEATPPPVEVATAPPPPAPTADSPKPAEVATVQPGTDAGKAADDAKKAADDAAKAADKAAKDAAKAADDISKGKAADDAAKAADKAAKDADKAAKDAAKDADKAAKDAAKDADKAAKDAAKQAKDDALGDLIKKLTKSGKQISGKGD